MTIFPLKVNPSNTELARAADFKARGDADRADTLAADAAWFRAHPEREWRARRARQFEITYCPYDYMQGAIFVVVPRCEQHRRDRFQYRFQARVDFPCDTAHDQWCATVAATAWATLHQCDSRPFLITN
jgi:hypothetical protein